MCSMSRKYLRYSKKKILKSGPTPFFTKNVIKIKKSATGSKLSPHKNVTTKKTKYLLVELTTYRYIRENSVYITTLQYLYSAWVNTYYRLNVTDLGLVFLTPGIFSKAFSQISVYSNFLNTCNNLGMPVLNYKVGQVISNVKSFANGASSSSSGTYSVVSSVSGGSVSLKLPSGAVTAKKQIVSYLGQNIIIPKLSNYRYKKTLLRVRGIAKNPVDHPNGGRSNTKGSFKTPWGKVAKFSK